MQTDLSRFVPSVAGACLVLFFVPASSSAAERVVEESLAVDADVRLRLEAFKGEIRVRTADVRTVSMKATIRPDDGPVEDLDLVHVRTTGGGGSVRIEVDYDRELTSRDDGWLGWNESVSLPFVDFEIEMPDGGDLWLESHKSKFDVSAPAGSVEIETHKGEGEIRNVRGDFELDTHKGRFDVEIARLGDVRVETHKGDVRLRVAGASDFEVRADTHKGDLRFRGHDVPVRRGDDDERRVDYRAGSGGPTIELDTHKGTIEVEFE